LTIAAGVGLSICWLRRKSVEDQLDRRKKSVGAIAEGLSSAGAMVLIIGAGGAFGYMMRQTDVAQTLKEMLPASKLALLPLAFLVTALVRGAQGSAIVSMVTGVGIVAPLATHGSLGFHPVYLALAIGCGSKPCLWMNDAGFWIIGKMSGMTETETLKTVSIMMTIMGVVGLIATMLGAWLLPFK
jgi:GntP family gluconate:H+ symporter